MSKYTVDKLADGGILVGNGYMPWWFNPSKHDPSVLYSGPIPVGDVISRLFHWDPVEAPAAFLVPCELDAPSLSLIHDDQPYKLIVDSDRKGIVRSDTGQVFGSFGKDYKPHHYRTWLIENVSSIMGDTLSISTAGMLDNGAVAWVQVGLGETVKAAGMEFYTNLMATSSLNGKVATTYAPTITTTVCDNTWSMAMAEGKKSGHMVKVKHSKYSVLKLENSRDALGIINQTTDDYGTMLEEWASKPVTDSEYSAILETVIPVPEDDGIAKTKALSKHGEMRIIWSQDQMVAPWRNTALGVMQAFNTYDHWYKPTRGGTDRFQRNWSDLISGDRAKSDSSILTVLRDMSLV